MSDQIGSPHQKATATLLKLIEDYQVHSFCVIRPEFPFEIFRIFSVHSDKLVSKMRPVTFNITLNFNDAKTRFHVNNELIDIGVCSV